MQEVRSLSDLGRGGQVEFSGILKMRMSSSLLCAFWTLCAAFSVLSDGVFHVLCDPNATLSPKPNRWPCQEHAQAQVAAILAAPGCERILQQTIHFAFQLLDASSFSVKVSE